MGSVYEAIDLQTGLRVAVKVITAEAAANETLMSRFEREARAAAAIDTPHIVRVLGSGRDEERQLPFLVLEYLEGEDLHQLIKRLGPLAPDLALRIAAQACIGLQSAHEMQIVHRDIKPANFFLTQTKGGQRIVKLLDFGVAKIKTDPVPNPGDSAGALTRTGSMLGSPLYMSPEQARGRRDLDQRSDIWSLGVVLYQALSGHTPHRDTDLLGELLILICTEAPEPLQGAAPWVQPALASLVHRALRFNVGERFQTAAEMGAAITALLPGDTTIHEGLLRPIADGERAAVAPLLTLSLHDAPAPRNSLHGYAAVEKTLATGQVREPSAPVLSASLSTSSNGAALDVPPVAGSMTSTAAFGTTVGRAGEGAPPSTNAAPPARAPSTILVLVTGAALLFLGAAVAYALARPTPAATSLAPTTTPNVAPLALRTVRLVVIPSDATVEVDGAKAIPRDGLVEIHGALGSVHAVRVNAFGEETRTNLVVTEDGAIPPKIELRPPAAKTIATPTATTPWGVPGPRSTAKPTAAPPHPPPPSDFRIGR